MKKTILITGGAGFIGQHLVRKLLADYQGVSIRILDNFNTQVHSKRDLPEDIKSKVDLIDADIRDRSALEKAVVGIDFLVHLAAETGTGQSMYEIDRYFSVNVQGTALLLDVLLRNKSSHNLKSIVLASSRAIYGEGAYLCNKDGLIYPAGRSEENLSSGMFDLFCPKCNDKLNLLPTSESVPFNPSSIYGLTKQVQEQSILLFCNMMKINGFGLRYQNVYGAGQSLKNPYTGILAVFSNLIRQNDPVDIYEDGEETRDFIYVSDVVDATIASIFYKRNHVGALNVGSGNSVSVNYVANAIKKYFNSSSLIKVSGNFRIGDIRHNIADISEIKKTLHFSPKVKFDDGLKLFLDWARLQPLEDKGAYKKAVNELASIGLMGQKES